MYKSQTTNKLQKDNNQTCIKIFLICDLYIVCDLGFVDFQLKEVTKWLRE